MLKVEDDKEIVSKNFIRRAKTNKFKKQRSNDDVNEKGKRSLSSSNRFKKSISHIDKIENKNEKKTLRLSLNAFSQDTPYLSLELSDLSLQKKFFVKAVADTGATKSVISYQLVKKFGIPIKKSQHKIKTADGSILPCEGEVNLFVNFQGLQDQVSFIVSRAIRDENVFLGYQDMKKFELLPANFPARIASLKCHIRHISNDKRNALINKFQDIFHERVGTMKGGKVSIKYEKGAESNFKQCAVARAIPHHFLEDANALVQKYIDEGILEKTDKPSKFLHPCLFVQKPGKNTGVRMVLDLSQFNRFVKKNEFPLPSPMEVLQAIPHTAKFFAKIDLVSSFYQIELDDESKDLFHFLIAGWGKLRLAKLPQGLKNSPFQLSRRIHEAFRDCPGVITLMDDVLVHAASESQLIERLTHVLSTCREWNFSLSQKKFILANEVKFGGYIISDKGFRPDKEKVAGEGKIFYSHEEVIIALLIMPMASASPFASAMFAFATPIALASRCFASTSILIRSFSALRAFCSASTFASMA